MLPTADDIGICSFFFFEIEPIVSANSKQFGEFVVERVDDGRQTRALCIAYAPTPCLHTSHRRSTTDDFDCHKSSRLLDLDRIQSLSNSKYAKRRSKVELGSLWLKRKTQNKCHDLYIPSLKGTKDVCLNQDKYHIIPDWIRINPDFLV